MRSYPVFVSVVASLWFLPLMWLGWDAAASVLERAIDLSSEEPGTARTVRGAYWIIFFLGWLGFVAVVSELMRDKPEPDRS
jgi:hypothetical protein